MRSGYELNQAKEAANTVVVFVPDYANPFNIDVLSGIEKAAKNHQYKMVYCRTKSGESDIDDYLSLLEDIRVAGIISLSPFQDINTIRHSALFNDNFCRLRLYPNLRASIWCR